MTKAKKQSLILVVAIVLVMFLIASVVFMSGIEQKVYADDSDIAIGSGDDVKNLMINGNVPSGYQGQGVAITTADELKQFLQDQGQYSGVPSAYLANNIDNFSWNNSFTNVFMAENKTLDGAGKTITMTATALNTSPWVSINKTADFRKVLTNSYFQDSTYKGQPFPDNQAGELVVDLNGGFVGYIPTNSVIKNINFVYEGEVSGSYSSQESGAGGIIAAINGGTIDNCSLTVNGYFDVTTTASERREWWQMADEGAYSEMARHSYAIGGYAGMMSGSNATVSNSKITLNETRNFVNSYIAGTSVSYKNTNISAVRNGLTNKSNVRLWGGGVVGWMANGAQVNNITTAGDGNIAAFTGTNNQNPLSYTGIVAGCAAVPEKAQDQSSLVGESLSKGTIDGVINTWTGRAVYHVNTTSFSPFNKGNNAVASQICGLSGDARNRGDSVSNVYFMYDQSAISESSVTGYNYSTKSCNMPVTYIYIMDYNPSTGKYDNVNGTAKANNAYLTFSGTTKEANVWAVYNTDLKNNPGAILWQIEVDLNSSDSAPGEIQNFYDKITSYKEANQYEITYTEIGRTQTNPVEVKYQLGKIVYYTMDFSKISGANTENPKNIILPDKQYDGKTVQLPDIQVRDFKDEIIQTIPAESASSYWKVKKADDMNLYSVDDTKNVGEYEYFVYNGDPSSAIDALDTTNRYVAYRNDNPDFPDDGSGSTGVGATAWQPRVRQNVIPKNLEIALNEPADFAANKQYDGEAVDFIPAITGIVGNDSVSAQLGYYDASGSQAPNNAAVNAGSYYVQVEGLTNSNYTFAPTRVDFTIEKRAVTIIDNSGAQGGDRISYELKLAYNGLDQALTYGIYNDETTGDEQIIITNVLEKDKGAINVSQIGDSKNVGQFTVEVKLNSGMASQNYQLSENVNYTVTIAPVDMQISLSETSKTVIYGQIYEPQVTLTGVNGEQLEPGEWFYIKKEDLTEPIDYEMFIPSIPRAAGEYYLVYYVYNDFGVNTNYNAAYSELVEYTVNKRDVQIFFDEGLPTEYAYTGESIVVAATYETQNNETNTGILDNHISKVSLKYTFTDKGGLTVDNAVDAGEYTVNAVLVAENLDTSSYNITYPDKAFGFTIVPKTVDITVEGAQKTYGSLDPEFVWNYANADVTFHERDNVVLTLSTTAGQFGAVGDYKIDANITSGTAGNYIVNTNEAYLTVVPYEVSIKTTTSKDVLTYGDEAPVLGFEYVGDNRFFEEDGVVINAVADKEIKNAGVYTVVVEGYTDNYLVNLESATFEILPKEITILSAEIVGGDTFTYTGSVIAPEVNAVFEDGVLIGDDTVGVAFDYFQDGVKVDAINVGTYDAVISSVNNPNYKLVVGEGLELPSTTFTIETRKVNINVGDATREYGIATITPKGEAYTYNGGDEFVQSDIESGRLTVDIVSDVALDAGAKDYADSVYVVIGGEAASNYELTIAQKGTLTITGANISSVQLANDTVVYTGENLIGNIKFNVGEGITGYAYKVTSDELGQNEITEIINAGTYYVVVYVDGDNSMFEGEPNILTFVVDKANRVLTADDINKIVNFNKLTFNCDFENMQYSVNDGAYLNTNVFDAKASTTYTVKAKAGESDNYYESNEVTFEVTTGIDTSSINAILNSMDKVDFSNLAQYKNMLVQLELVGEDDLASIDQDKLEALKDSYEELLSGAESVIGDAQKVAGKASGMTAKGAISLALTTGAGLALAGVMLSVSAKKKQKDDNKKMSVNKKSIVKIMTVVLVVAIICAVVMVGCKKTKFTQDSLFKLASYTTDSKEKSRDVSIEVKSDGSTIYTYDNGKENFIEGLENTGSFSLSGKNTGFDFKADYFENAKFANADGKATFSADIKNVSAFLGVSGAKNAKVNVEADSANNKLKTINVSYEVEKNSTTYTVEIEVEMKY